MSGRRNAPTTHDLMRIVTKLRTAAASSLRYRALEREFTAILQHHAFASDGAGDATIFVGGES